MDNVQKLNTCNTLCVSVSPHQLLNGSANFYETWYARVCQSTSAHLSSILNKSVCLCVYPPIDARQRLDRNVTAATE
jgi:hypothetical protein